MKNKYPKAIWLLAIGMTINVTGNSFLWPLNTIYITDILHKSMSVAGFVLMLQQGFGIIGNLIGGRLFDAQGGKRTIVIGILLSIIAVLSLSFIHDWYIYISLMLLLGFSNGLVFPSMYAMAGSVWPEGGRKAFNMIYVSQNFGVALGSTLGGIFAQYSFTLIFLVNAITFVLFLLLVLFGFDREHWQLARMQSAQQSTGVFTQDVVQEKRNFNALLIMSFAFVLSWIPYVQWQTSISKYIHVLGIPLSKYTILWTLNGAIIVLGQPIISLITKYLIKTTKKQMITGIFIFILAFTVLYNNSWYYGFILAMVIMTFAEMLVWPAVPSATSELAPSGKKGYYQGVISSSGAAGRMLGFLVGGYLYDHTSMNHLILIMITFFVISGFGFLNYDRFLKPSFNKENVTEVE